MLTRFQVSGFKNLVDVDVRFGPFTCIAGANGVGKSNLFDAIKFLGLTAKDTLKDAALAVRGGETGQGAVRNLFHKVGTKYVDVISYSAHFDYTLTSYDVVANKMTSSRLGVVYDLHFELQSTLSAGIIRNVSEKLTTDDKQHNLLLDRKDEHGLERFISIGNDRKVYSQTRTYVSILNETSIEKEGLIAKQELLNWHVLQIEPSAIRNPRNENYDTSMDLGDDGAHLAATLHRIAHTYRDENGNLDPEHIYAQVTSRLHELIGGDVQSIRVDDDDKRELYTLDVTDRNGTEHPARSLSDGTLRFLALITLWLDPEATGVFCIEEPENGIHPARLPALVRLLQNIAFNPEYPAGPDNPLRQVIVVTHSPEFVKLVPEDSLLLARNRTAVTEEGVQYSRAEFVPLAGTWRDTEDTPRTAVASQNELLAYLNPSVMSLYEDEDPDSNRVMDRPDLKPLLALTRE